MAVKYPLEICQAKVVSFAFYCHGDGMWTQKILNVQHIESALLDIDRLSPYWIRRAPQPLESFTLGAATYLDLTTRCQNYDAVRLKINPLLEAHLGWLYNLLISALSEDFGPMVLQKDLAFPGFHIFGARPDQSTSEEGCKMMERPIASVHIDAPYRAHMSIWSQYKKIDFLNPLSITLCLRLPKSGGGLNMWQEIDRKTHHAGHDMVDCRFSVVEKSAFRYIPYQTGCVYVTSGHQVHQIAPAVRMLPNDRRVTLQAHALQCDGVWRLFF
jgi:hypothetical protein